MPGHDSLSIRPVRLEADDAEGINKDQVGYEGLSLMFFLLYDSVAAVNINHHSQQESNLPFMDMIHLRKPRACHRGSTL